MRTSRRCLRWQIQKGGDAMVKISCNINNISSELPLRLWLQRTIEFPLLLFFLCTLAACASPNERLVDFAGEGNLSQIKELISSKSVVINATNPSKQNATALFYASEKGQLRSGQVPAR